MKDGGGSKSTKYSFFAYYNYWISIMEAGDALILQKLCNPIDRSRMEADKYEVMCFANNTVCQMDVSLSFNFGEVDNLDEEEYLNKKIEIGLVDLGRNVSKTPALFERIEFCSSDNIDTSSSNNPFVIDPIPKEARLPLTVTIRLNPVVLPLGFYSKWLVMKFQTTQFPHTFETINRHFLITRKVIVKVVNSNDMTALNVDAPSFIPEQLRKLLDCPSSGKMKLPKGT